MIKFIPLLLNLCQSEISLRISGGTNVQRGYDWVVQVKTRDDDGRIAHFCTGSVISPEHVVTAARCLVDDNNNRLKSAEIVFGATSRDDSRAGRHEFINLGSNADVLIHNSYDNEFPMYFNIAVFKLPSQKYTAVDNRIEYPIFAEQEAVSGESLQSISWGDTAANVRAFSLQRGAFQAATCPSYDYDNKPIMTAVLRKTTCAYSQSSDFCFGDDGAPLFSNIDGGNLSGIQRLYGLLAFYDDNCENSSPSFFVDLADQAIINWIASQTGYSKNHYYGIERAISTSNDIDSPTFAPRTQPPDTQAPYVDPISAGLISNGMTFMYKIDLTMRTSRQWIAEFSDLNNQGMLLATRACTALVDGIKLAALNSGIFSFDAVSCQVINISEATRGFERLGTDLSAELRLITNEADEDNFKGDVDRILQSGIVIGRLENDLFTLGPTPGGQYNSVKISHQYAPDCHGLSRIQTYHYCASSKTLQFISLLTIVFLFK